MNSTVEVYEKLKATVGTEGAKALVEYVDSKVEREAVTKVDLNNVETSLRAEIKEVEVRLKMLEREMRIYFIIITLFIFLNNQRALDILIKILGIAK